MAYMKNAVNCHADLKKLISTRNYPCVAAIQASHKEEIWGDVYEDFGSGRAAPALLRDLLQFKKMQQENNIAYLTYVAYYPQDIAESEEDFERGLWAELSALWNDPEVAGGWDPQFSDDPEDRSFCFSLGGSAFFVVGLHARSSRLSRRLPYNALAFNLYGQFRSLMEKGSYDDMVKINRGRDLKYQGDVNPMASAYQDSWEAIQFSGRKNSDSWQCPFTKGLQGLLVWPN